MLSLSGDTETNPGKKCNLNNHPTIYHLNLNSLSAHNFAKVQLSIAYLAVHKFDIECFSGTYLDSSFLFMIRSCIYPAMSLSGVIVQLKVNVEVDVYIVKTVYH